MDDLIISGGADQARTDETVMVAGQVSLNKARLRRWQSRSSKFFINKNGAKAPFSLTKISGGADQTRTDDPLLAKQVLYQLSYNPRTLRY